MIELNQQNQTLVEALESRLESTDLLDANTMLIELETSEPFTNPAHENHKAYQVMRSQVIARQIELTGRNPYESGNDNNSSMMDNQTYHTDGDGEDKLEASFIEDDESYNLERENAVKYLNRLQNNEFKSISSEELPHHIKAAKEQLDKMDATQVQTIKDREAELERIETWELGLEAEQSAKLAERKKEFMAVALKDVHPLHKEEMEKIAQAQWARTQYGY